MQRKHKLQDILENLNHEKQRILPFGNFAPRTVQDLEAYGLYIQLFTIPLHQELNAPAQAILAELNTDKNVRYMAMFSQERITPPGLTVPLPAKSLDEIKHQILELEKEKAFIREELSSLNAYYFDIHNLLVQARDRVQFAQAKAGMESLGPVAAIQGFSPENTERTLQELARKEGWGLSIADPGPDDDPPTLIRNPAWVRPVQAVFALINIVPGYRETDISVPFLLFLSLFFAMIIGDAGYGGLFLIITIIGRHFLNKIYPALFPFLLLMSLSTLIWGLLTGNVLGTSPTGPVFSELKIDWLTGPGADERLMLMCFLIGAVHLSLAHMWRMAILWPSPRVLAQLGWLLLTWVMFHAARSLVLMHDFPLTAVGMLGAGLLLILAFMRPMGPATSQLMEYIRLPLDIVNQFVDLVSYIRLFAVGTATVAVAQAFNQMALDLGFDGIVSGLGAAIILFLGHSLNIALAAMGVLVHGVRLNTLEFASHAGITWSGTQFLPFARHKHKEQIWNSN
jgi:V/A-type H+-transporting ATPase subunit I